MSANFPGALTGNMPGMGPLPPIQDRMMNPAYNNRAADYNAQQLAQVLAILQANPGFLPNRMMPPGQPQLTPRPGVPTTMTPQQIQSSIRQPMPGQVAIDPAMRAYAPVRPQQMVSPVPAQFVPRPMPAPSMGTQNRLQPKLTAQLRPAK